VDAHLFRLTVLVLPVASLYTNRMRDYNAEVFTATLVTIRIICLATNRYVIAGWAAIVIGVANTPAAVVALVLLAILQAARTRRLRHLLAVPAALALIMLEAWIRRGSPLDTGYGAFTGSGRSCRIPANPAGAIRSYWGWRRFCSPSAGACCSSPRACFCGSTAGPAHSCRGRPRWG
jgi:hypothetical protein